MCEQLFRFLGQNREFHFFILHPQLGNVSHRHKNVKETLRVRNSSVMFEKKMLTYPIVGEYPR